MIIVGFLLKKLAYEHNISVLVSFYLFLLDLVMNNMTTF